MSSRSWRPLIVGLGGTPRVGSSTEVALRRCLDAAADYGADTLLLTGESLTLPLYDPGERGRTTAAGHLIAALRRADGVLIASPGYHGSISGLIKNALDYTEDLREDPRPYLEGRAVGCVVCAHGWQATGSTLMTLRAVIHALRGWPTPLGVVINSSVRTFDESGACVDSSIRSQLTLVARQVVDFARMRYAEASSARQGSAWVCCPPSSGMTAPVT